MKKEREMRYFSCPKCNLKVKALATDVSHRCPSFQRKLVAFVREEQNESNNKQSGHAK